MRKVVITEDIIEGEEIILSKGQVLELVSWNSAGEYTVQEIDNNTEYKMQYLVYDDEWKELN